jgi:hypothetical protein
MTGVRHRLQSARVPIEGHLSPGIAGDMHVEASGLGGANENRQPERVGDQNVRGLELPCDTQRVNEIERLEQHQRSRSIEAANADVLHSSNRFFMRESWEPPRNVGDRSARVSRSCLPEREPDLLDGASEERRHGQKRRLERW